MKILKDKQANGGISFLVIVFLLMYILMSFVPLVKTVYTEIFMIVGYTKTLDVMQHTGGLTAGIENNTISMLENAGLNAENITITGTVATVDYGDEIGVTIEYTDTITRYVFDGKFGINIINEVKIYEMSGSTISYYFENDGG